MKKGYTLVELLIVLAIIGIVISIGYSSYKRATCKHGHERKTGGLSCTTTGSFTHCEPEVEFICEDGDQ